MVLGAVMGVGGLKGLGGFWGWFGGRVLGGFGVYWEVKRKVR